MPLYEYECEACEKRFEIIQKFSDPSPDACKVCGKGPVRRLMSSPAIQFKGSGWYITDYSQKGKSVSADSADSPKGDSKDAKPADAPASGDGAKPAAAPAASATPAKSDAT
jgi:putative FmdB family regulatory protein